MNSHQKLNRLQALFDDAIQLDMAQRESFLDVHCHDDAELKDALTNMLMADDKAGDFLEKPVISPKGQLEPPDPGDEIQELGPYQIFGKIGQGGTSSIYLAQRFDRRWQRRVAIKILKGQTSGSDQRDRILREAQLLAHLDHAGIARVIDSDCTEDGLPYLVMEYVHGEPITTYCNKHRLSVEKRLQLFTWVCESVHYAHKNLVVHRDLKPSNILVGVDGRPKLIDFGFAKLLETYNAAETTQNVRMLTPNYASPEYLAGNPFTTASDTYSLGVLLYELLTGVRPHDWSSMNHFEILKQWPRANLVPPSRHANLNQFAPFNKATKSDLVRHLKGDLDNIALKALAFAPNDRYSSPAQLVEDLQRSRDNQPISAQAASRSYRLRKYLRRNLRTISYIAIMIAVLGAWAFSASMQARRFAQERDVARFEHARADQVTQFLVNAFEVNNPHNDLSPDITAREVLASGSARIDQDLSEDHELRGVLKHTIGSVYNRMGLFKEALLELEAAIALRGTAKPNETASSLGELAWAQRGLGYLDQAEQTTRTAISLREQAGNTSILVAKDYRLLADILSEQGKHEASEKAVRSALELHERVLGPKDGLVADDLNSLCMTLYRLGDFSGSEAAVRRSIEIVESHPDNNPASLASVVNNLGAALRAQGRLNEAAPAYERALALRKTAFGVRSPAVANSLNSLALFYQDLGDFKRAETFIRESLSINQEQLGHKHPSSILNEMNLGEILDGSGQSDLAVKVGLESVRKSREYLSESPPYLSWALHTAGVSLLHHRQLAQARALINEALSIRNEAMTKQHPDRLLSLLMLAKIDHIDGKLAEARKGYLEFIEFGTESWNGHQWQYAWGQMLYADFLVDCGQSHEAKALAHAAYRRLVKILHKDQFRLQTASSILGLSLFRSGDEERGLEIMQISLKHLQSSRQDNDLHLHEARHRLHESN